MEPATIATVTASRKAKAREMCADEIIDAALDLYKEVAESGVNRERSTYFKTLESNYRQLTGNSLLADAYQHALKNTTG